MLKGATVIIVGATIAAGMMAILSAPYLTTTQVLLIPIAAVMTGVFVGAGCRVEWILLVMIINVMIGSTRLFEGSVVNINRLMGAAMVILLFIDIVVLKRKKLVIDILGTWILLFGLTVTISLIFTQDWSVSRGEFRLYLRAFILYILIAHIVTTPLWFNRVVATLIFAGILLTGFGMIDSLSFRIFGLPIGDKLGLTSTSPEMLTAIIRNRDPNRLYGALGNTADVNYFALILVTLFPLSLAFLNRRSKGYRLLTYVGGAMILSGIVLSLSRGATLAFVFGVVLMVRVSLIRKRILVVAALVLILCAPLVSMSSFKRIYSIALYPFSHIRIQNVDIQNVKNRLNYMRAGLKMFMDYPIIGVGIGNFPYLYPKYAPAEGVQRERLAHNTYLQILTETGIVGFSLFMCGIVYCFWILKEIRDLSIQKKDAWLHRNASILVVSLSIFLVAAFFVSAAHIDILWIVMGLTSCLRSMAGYSETTSGIPELNSPSFFLKSSNL